MRPLIRYIGPLLISGIMFVCTYTPNHTGAGSKPALVGPVVKQNCPVVKKLLPAQLSTVSLTKRKDDESDKQQTGQNNFSFVRDVIMNIIPSLKYLE